METMISKMQAQTKEKYWHKLLPRIQFNLNTQQSSCKIISSLLFSHIFILFLLCFFHTFLILFLLYFFHTFLATHYSPFEAVYCTNHKPNMGRNKPLIDLEYDDAGNERELPLVEENNNENEQEEQEENNEDEQEPTAPNAVKNAIEKRMELHGKLAANINSNDDKAIEKRKESIIIREITKLLFLK